MLNVDIVWGLANAIIRFLDYLGGFYEFLFIPPFVKLSDQKLKIEQERVIKGRKIMEINKDIKHNQIILETLKGDLDKELERLTAIVSKVRHQRANPGVTSQIQIGVLKDEMRNVLQVISAKRSHISKTETMVTLLKGYRDDKILDEVVDLTRAKEAMKKKVSEMRKTTNVLEMVENVEILIKMIFEGEDVDENRVKELLPRNVISSLLK